MRSTSYALLVIGTRKIWRLCIEEETVSFGYSFFELQTALLPT